MASCAHSLVLQYFEVVCGAVVTRVQFQGLFQVSFCLGVSLHLNVQCTCSGGFDQSDGTLIMYPTEVEIGLSVEGVKLNRLVEKLLRFLEPVCCSVQTRLVEE